MVVTVEHDVGVGRVQGRPERSHAGAVADPPGAEAGVVPVRQDALVRVGRQVALEPADLGARGASRERVLTSGVRAVRVQRDDMPGAQFVGVVAVGGRRTEVAEIAGGHRALRVFVVAGCRMDDRVEHTPGGVVGAGGVELAE